MAGGMSKMAKRELLATIQDRYRRSFKKDKSRILDEFIAVTGHHRKHASGYWLAQRTVARRSVRSEEGESTTRRPVRW